MVDCALRLGGAEMAVAGTSRRGPPGRSDGVGAGWSMLGDLRALAVAVNLDCEL